ncbi:MAG: aminoacyl-tRNA hydrolase [Firmicutes bacterium]|nr:aminoacyl-tRNA hydrolase [Bacillota bacterium]
MTIIAGLGNPEKEYKNTRHNTGFEVVNKLACDHGVPINRAKFRAFAGEGFIGGKKVLLLKPQTYMNLSGECVRDVLAWYRLTPGELVVVYDDCALPVGDVRVRKQGGAGGHNGMKNILYHLGTDEFARVRVGIGEKPERLVLADYVLSQFRKDELDGWIAGVTKAAEAVEDILSQGADFAMNKFNRKLGANE